MPGTELTELCDAWHVLNAQWIVVVTDGGLSVHMEGAGQRWQLGQEGPAGLSEAGQSKKVTKSKGNL